MALGASFSGLGFTFKGNCLRQSALPFLTQVLFRQAPRCLRGGDGCENEKEGGLVGSNIISEPG